MLNDLPFDYRPAYNATLNDLDTQFFQECYLPKAISREVPKQSERSLEQRLASLHFLSHEGCPTKGALIALGKDPLAFVGGAYVQFLRIDGTELTDPIKNANELSGPLYEVLAALDNLLKLNISTAIDFTSANTEIRTPDYPLEALQQLSRNAIMHRNYETSNAPVRIYWYEDRIEIMNPGGLYGRVNAENFGKGHAADYRNCFITEFMKTLRYVKKFGMGLAIAKKALQKNNNSPLEFPLLKTCQESFVVTIRKRT